MTNLFNKIINFFNKLATRQTNNYQTVEDPQLALELLESLSIGYSLEQTNNYKISKIINSCNNRQEILNKVIEICGEPNTPMKRYIYAKTYGWSNKEYRQLAIKYITLYLNNPLYEDIYLHKFRNINDSLEKRKNDHICDMKEMLADTYIKEYEFEKALNIYNEIIDAEPEMPIFYEKKVNALIKLNRIDESIVFLKNVKKSSYYRTYKEYSPTTWFKDTIDSLLKDCIEKKLNNYIYKPRKQKNPVL